MTGPSSLHGKNALVFALALVCASTLGGGGGGSVLVGVALGGAIQMVNLRLLERTVAALLGLAQARGRAGVLVLVALRFSVLMGLCVVILLTLRVHPVAFAAGFSTAVPALFWHGLQGQREV